jgi:hypothetical protein
MYVFLNMELFIQLYKCSLGRIRSKLPVKMLKLFYLSTLRILSDAKGKTYTMPISVKIIEVLIFFGLGIKAKSKKEILTYNCKNRYMFGFSYL